MPNKIKKGDYFIAIETDSNWAGRKIGPFKADRITARAIYTKNDERVFMFTSWNCVRAK